MKLFKTVDDKLKEIGCVKTKENEYGIEYEKTNATDTYECFAYSQNQ